MWPMSLLSSAPPDVGIRVDRHVPPRSPAPGNGRRNLAFLAGEVLAHGGGRRVGSRVPLLDDRQGSRPD